MLVLLSEPTFKPPAKAGYFRVGSVTPKKSRALCKPAVEKRKHNYKRGINSAENRQRRSQLSRDLGLNKKSAAIQKLRSARSANGKACHVRDVLISFYNVHNPSKLCEVDKTLERYTGKEEELFTNLAKRYNVNPSIFGIDEEDVDTPVKSNATGAFMAYASSNNTFGSLATPPRASGFGSSATQAPSSDNGRRRNTINSLNTFAGEMRASFAFTEMDCD